MGKDSALLKMEHAFLALAEATRELREASQDESAADKRASGVRKAVPRSATPPEISDLDAARAKEKLRALGVPVK